MRELHFESISMLYSDDMSFSVLTTTFNGHFMLQELLHRGHSVHSVVGLNQIEFNRLGSERYSSKNLAQSFGIRFHEANTYNLSSELDRVIFNSIKSDYLLVLGWQRIVPSEIFHQFKSIGIHGSDKGIQFGKGRSPQNWALILGAHSFEFSAFSINEGIDSGEILQTSEIAISNNDDIQSLHFKVGKEAVNLLELVFENSNRKLFSIKSDEEVKVEAPEYLPKREPSDGEIDWSRQTVKLYNFIRALSHPYSCAFTTLHGSVFRILRSKVICEDSSERFLPGRVRHCISSSTLVVECSDGLLLIEVSGDSRVNFAVGDVFSSVDFAIQMQRIFDRHQKKYPQLPIAKRLLSFS